MLLLCLLYYVKKQSIHLYSHSDRLEKTTSQFLSVTHRSRSEGVVLIASNAKAVTGA